ncbi:MAG: heme exporter protein CcmD [Gordonibacter sp.]|uniref:heme exporter protein CcmD n=1 Tax=Gordonibacter sp. TaxID=1968902 RepID=UPI002FCCA8DA
MNPVLAEIYSTIFPAAPYVIGAYALIFLVLFVFVFITLRGLKKTEQQMALLEEAVAEKAAN